ncbi:hypothetical protein VOLCADRAFT_105894 [Volvox carteri f. nagariensis]|uniref:Protein PAM68, chloroplastic n=1 Tax=Volvox carteri f. nagariensis TaxID=3068 RepID=D8U3Y1_VOLCA|nr:uncharacterized protein VOLCADRAFT_105894 [Volvox carteri f. nagariensis]EFJ45609.1 hypothetical protein VOLCADRAFT_105894 [Volvox carteri f. nagariensis]|eukprot:XP_002953299.1 hypothetical protein VOLCADRAFT_105894 [Volvox carteri f. nagariensis]
MAPATVRPFTTSAQRHGNMLLRPARYTRVVLPPMAARKGFGEPKRDQAKRPEAPPQQQQGPASTSGNGSGPAAFEAAQSGGPVPRTRVVRETPQVVVDRMFRRILVCTGVPVFTGMALFPLFYWLRVVQDIDYPLWIVYIAQVLTFGGGLLGITYGALSASWDPSREGSALGWTELQANLAILLNRNKN